MTESANVRITRDDGVAVVSLTGEIDLVNAAEVARAADQGIDGTEHVIVDLEDIVFMDSQAIALLDRLAGRLEREGRALVVVAPTTSVPRRVLEIVDLGIGLFEDRESARAALASGAADEGSPPIPGDSPVR